METTWLPLLKISNQCRSTRTPLRDGVQQLCNFLQLSGAITLQTVQISDVADAFFGSLLQMMSSPHCRLMLLSHLANTSFILRSNLQHYKGQVSDSKYVHSTTYRSRSATCTVIVHLLGNQPLLPDDSSATQQCQRQSTFECSRVPRDPKEKHIEPIHSQHHVHHDQGLSKSWGAYFAA